MSQVIKSLPKGHDSGRRLAVASTGQEVGLESQPSQLPPGFPSQEAQSSVHNTFEYHDQRSQQVHVGVDLMVFSNMVAEARRVIQESEEKAQGLEKLAQEVYQQACTRIQELVGLAETLYQSYSSKAFEIGKLQQDVQSTRDQLQVQINRNQTLDFQITRFESQMSNVQNLFGHKDAEINRLMSEVSRLRSSEARLEERLAALSAAPSVAAPNVEAQIRSSLVHSVPGNLVGTVDGQVVESPNDHVANGLQSSMEQRLDSMMAAIQILSDRMIDYEQNGADSNPVYPSNSRSPQPSGFINPVGPPDPPPDDGDWPEDEGGDSGDLVVEEKAERDLVDNRALQSAKLEPLPNNAADFRVWKNALILMLGRLDISGIDYLTNWIAVAFRVDSAEECSNSSGLVPRLDRWLASELIKSLKGVPELQFKVQGYIESCTRQSQAPRGRLVVHMISRHFDLDRVRGSLITSQSVFLVELNGYSVSDLQEFSSNLMKVLNQIQSTHAW